MYFLLVEDYVTSLENLSILADKLCKRSYGGEKSGLEFFPCHLTPVQLHDGIKNGKYLQGTFAVSRENFLEGYVNTEGMEKSVSNWLFSILFVISKYVYNYIYFCF